MKIYHLEKIIIIGVHVVILIIVFCLDILFAILYLSDPKTNSWALIFLLIIDVPLGLYIRCAQCNKPKEKPNDPPANKILKLSKDQNGMLVVDIDNTAFSYPIVNTNKFLYIKEKENGFFIIIELLDRNKIKLVNTPLNPSTSVSHLNDHLNKLKVNIVPIIY